MKMSTFRAITTALLALALMAALPSGAAGKDKQKNKHGRNGGGKQVAVDIFVGSDRELIRGYFAEPHSDLPPGLSKRGGNLPPGLAKQLRRKGHLPPGLDKRVVPFPLELERRLPPLRSGLRRGFIEGHAVIFNERTSLILDVVALF
jgi:hypothetical protein